jgi:hypothetical protein
MATYVEAYSGVQDMIARKYLERTEGRSASVVETPQPSSHVHACSFLQSRVEGSIGEIPDFEQR